MVCIGTESNAFGKFSSNPSNEESQLSQRYFFTIPKNTRWGSIHNGILAKKGTNAQQLQWSLEQETSAWQSQVEV